MTIAVGDKLPDVEFFTLGEGGPQAVSTASLFAGKKIALLAIPGAFTPTCDEIHVPGFLGAYDAFKAKGVDEIYCVSVNDPFVMAAWSKALGLGGKITMIADGNRDFTKAVGLDFDASVIGLGMRCGRYSMLVEDGVVKALNVEESPRAVVVSSAAVLLENM